MDFRRIELHRFLTMVQKPSRYINHELNAWQKQPSEDTVNFCLAFPDVYEVGISHLGLKILYTVLNQCPETVADRVYAPWSDLGALLKEHQMPLPAVESKIAIADFDCIGFTLQSELNFTNILYMLDLAQIPFRQKDRDESYPIIIAGGPCASNPEPLAEFIDAFLIGEGEEAIVEIRNVIALRRTSSKTEILERLSQIPGMYVPALYQTAEGRPMPTKAFPYPIAIRKYADFSSYQNTHEPQLITWQQATHDRFVSEIMRGCTRGCRFCHAGMFYRPIRERNPQDIIDHILKEVEVDGWEEAALTSLSSCDYSSIRELLLAIWKRLEENRASISLPSLRVDSLDDDLVKLMNYLGQTGLTIAPEAGSQRLRDCINKNISEEEILEGVQIALRNGWRIVKFYFMVGLPFETEEDVLGIVSLIEKIISISGKKLEIHVTLSPFIPKPFTPFQWAGVLEGQEILRRIFLVKNALKRYKFVKIRYHEVESTLLEAIMSRGDRSVADLLEQAYRNGCYFDGWHEFFDFSKWEEAAAKINMDWKQYLQPRDVEAPLIWDHIDLGIKKSFLQREWYEAEKGRTSNDCRGGCQDCGVCNEEIQMTNANNPTVQDYQHQPIQRPTNQKKFLYRVYYSRLGDLRFIAHLDVTRMIFRLVRRNNFPIAYSEGFNKHPRVSFSPPLSLGVEGEQEFFDIYLVKEMPVGEVAQCMKQNLSGVVPFLGVEAITSLDAVVADEYAEEITRLEFPQKWHALAVEKVAQFNDAQTWQYERERKGKVHTHDLKEIIHSMKYEDGIVSVLKNLKGCSVFDLLEQVFGILRDDAWELRIVRQELLYPRR